MSTNKEHINSSRSSPSSEHVFQLIRKSQKPNQPACLVRIESSATPRKDPINKVIRIIIPIPIPTFSLFYFQCILSFIAFVWWEISSFLSHPSFRLHNRTNIERLDRDRAAAAEAISNNKKHQQQQQLGKRPKIDTWDKHTWVNWLGRSIMLAVSSN